VPVAEILEHRHLTKTMQTRILTALDIEGITTIGQMRAYLDQMSYLDSSGTRQYIAAIYRLPNIGAKAAQLLKNMLEDIL
jgi:hypothetical protein